MATRSTPGHSAGLGARLSQAVQRAGRRPIARLATLVGAVLTAGLLFANALEAPFLTQIKLLAFDVYQRAAPRAYDPAAPVRVVDIDDESLRRLGQWPWPRTDLARLIDRIGEAGAAVIALDIVFAEPDRTSPARIAAVLAANPAASGDYAELRALQDHDQVLADAFTRQPVVAGAFLTPAATPESFAPKAGFAWAGDPPLGAVRAYPGSTPPLPELVAAADGIGFLSFEGDRDGVVRRAPLVAQLGDAFVPALSIEALRVAQGAGSFVGRSSTGSGELGARGAAAMTAIKVGDITAPTDARGEMWVHYTRAAPERIVPAWQVLAPDATPETLAEQFAGRVVFIGSGAAGLLDLKATPLSSRDLGVLVHANAAEQMLLGQFLERPDWAPGVERAVLLFGGLILAFAVPAFGALRGALLGAGLVGAHVGGAWFAFREGGLLIDPTFPAVGLALVFLATAVVSFWRTERERGEIRQAFSHYLAPEVVERIAKEPSLLKLGGESRELTILFSDIRGFSKISEKLKPEEIIELLNGLLTPFTDALLSRKGTIDKYIGDAVMAFWNAPLDDPDHPRNAALGALDMLDRLAIVNGELASASRSANWPTVVEVGIGLNSGSCAVGNMGSDQRFSYSIIGDAVNLAARIEGLTKHYRVPILVGEATAAQLSDFALLEADRIRVVGRQTPERIFALLGRPAAREAAGWPDLAALHGQALEAYRARHWDAAAAHFVDLGARTVPGVQSLSGYAATLSERIESYRAEPPPADWDGVWTARDK